MTDKRASYLADWRGTVLEPLYERSRETSATALDTRARLVRDGTYLSQTGSITPSTVRSYNDDVELASVNIRRPPRAYRNSATESWITDVDSIAESAVPQPLRPRPNRQTIYNLRAPRELPQGNPYTAPWDVPDTQPQAYGGAGSKVQQRLGVDNVDVNHYYLNELPPRPTPGAKRLSLNRLSLTSCEMPYPPGLLSQGNGRAEHLLGMRSSSPPPPPPKSPRHRSRDSSATLFENSTATKYIPQSEQKDEDVLLEPQNGRIAWRHALTAVLVVFNCWGMANAFGIFQAYYGLYYLRGTDPSSISWIGSTQLALVFGLGMPVGKLVDKGYFRHMFHGGSIIMVLGIFCTAWCHSLWSLWLVQGLMTGLGMGMVFCSGIAALMTWFDEKKMGVAMGLSAAGSCVGGIVYVLLARHFLPTRGFATTMRVLGGVAAVSMIPPNLVFRLRTTKSKLQPIPSTSPPASIRTKSPNHSPAALPPRPHKTRPFFLQPAYLLAASGLFFAFLGVYFGFVYLVSYASTVLHLSNTRASNLLIYMLAANLPGRFLPALISDRCIGPLNTIIPSVFLSAAVIGLWLATSTVGAGALTVIACFYGFVSAGVQVLYAPTVYTFCLDPPSASLRRPEEEDGSHPTAAPERDSTDRMGLKAGVIFSCIGLACLIGTPIGGALINYRTNRGMSDPYLGAQVFAMVALGLGGVLLLASRVARVGWEAVRA